MQQISAHIRERGGGFVEVYSFLAEKKKTVSPFHSSAQSVFVSLDNSASSF